MSIWQFSVIDKEEWRNDAGTSLLELMVVIVILGVLAAVVSPHLLSQMARAKTSVSKQQIAGLVSALTLYKVDVGEYPTSEEGLLALISPPTDVENWGGPYIEQRKVPKDPWGHEFIYRNPAIRGGHSYDLCSRGENNSSNSTEVDESLCNE